MPLLRVGAGISAIMLAAATRLAGSPCCNAVCSAGANCRLVSRRAALSTAATCSSASSSRDSCNRSASRRSGSREQGGDCFLDGVSAKLHVFGIRAIVPHRHPQCQRSCTRASGGVSADTIEARQRRAASATVPARDRVAPPRRLRRFSKCLCSTMPRSCAWAVVPMAQLAGTVSPSYLAGIFVTCSGALEMKATAPD